MTTSIGSSEKPETDNRDQVDSRSRILTTTVVVLAVVVLGLGAWTVYGMSSTAETAVTAEVQRVVDDYLAAWNSFDGEAFRELVTDDYVLDMVGATDSRTMRGDEASELVDSLEAFEWSEAVIGEPSTSPRLAMDQKASTGSQPSPWSTMAAPCELPDTTTQATTTRRFTTVPPAHIRTHLDTNEIQYAWAFLEPLDVAIAASGM
jgi:hypothetical protein